MTLKDRELSLLEEFIINEVLKAFQEVCGDTIIKQKKDIIGIGVPGQHLFCYFIDKNDLFCVKFKGIKEHISAHSDLSTYIKDTLELFKTNDFSIKHKIKKSEKKQAQIASDENSILTNEESVFFKIMLKNIDPKTGEMLNMSKDSINFLSEVFNKLNSIKLQKQKPQKEVNNKPIDEHEITYWILEDYKSGATLLDIFHQYDLSFDKIKSILKSNGIAPRKDLIKSTYKLTLIAIENFKSFCNKGSRWSKEEENKLKEEYENFISITLISKIHKRSKGGIKARLVRLGYGRFEGEIPEIFTRLKQ